MSVRATFTPGATSVTTKALHQWDYGQQLEIEAVDLPTIIEVHFACSGMTEAIVTSCSVADGVGIVTIPNSCLEQSSQIIAWVYEISGNHGETTKTITIPVAQRIRPGRTDEVPQEISDKYTQLIEQINDAVGALADGTVITKHASNADNAKYAASAGNASSAAYATSAGNAATATNADKANTATSADTATLLTPTVLMGEGTAEEGEDAPEYEPYEITVAGCYMFELMIKELEDYKVTFPALIWIQDIATEARAANIAYDNAVFEIKYDPTEKRLVVTETMETDYDGYIGHIARIF